MSKKIRLGVFETNSSSSHSVSIGTGNKMSERLTMTPESNITAAIRKLARNYGVEDDDIWEYLKKCHGFKESYRYKTLLLDGDQYGWGYDVVDSAVGKLDYAFTYIVCRSVADHLENDNNYKLLKKVVRDMTGCEIFPNYFDGVASNDEVDYYAEELRFFLDHNNLGGFKITQTDWDGEEREYTEADAWMHNIYIDHQSVDMLDEYFEDEEKLKELIFNPEYKIIIDNDNH